MYVYMLCMYLHIYIYIYMAGKLHAGFPRNQSLSDLGQQYSAINCKAETDKDASTGWALGRAGCIWGNSWGADQNRVSLTLVSI